VPNADVSLMLCLSCASACFDLCLSVGLSVSVSALLYVWLSPLTSRLCISIRPTVSLFVPAVRLSSVGRRAFPKVRPYVPFQNDVRVPYAYLEIRYAYVIPEK